MDNEEQEKQAAAHAKEVALAIIPHLDAIGKILGPENQITLTTIFKHPTGDIGELVMGNGDFVMAAYILLKWETTRLPLEEVASGNYTTKH